jgi:cold shock protein
MSSSEDSPPSSQSLPTVPIVNEVNNEPKVGKYVGQCKWWSDKMGYGFITVQQGDMKGRDIFLHHTGVRPLNSIYRTLKKGEYINFDIIEGANGLQATNVTGIGGGTLICDVNPYVKPVARAGAPPPPMAATPASVPYYHGPPPHTLAAAAYITPMPTRAVGGGRGARVNARGLPFNANAPNRPYYRPRPAAASVTTEDVGEVVLVEAPSE